MPKISYHFAASTPPTFAPVICRLCMPAILALFLLLPARGACTDYTFDYTPGCAAAYKAYLALRISEGDAQIKRELFARPYNLLPVYIADYGDFLTLLFNGDNNERRQRAAHEEERLSRLALGPGDSPWKRLAQAGIHLHWALIRIRYGDQLKAAFAFRRSYILLKENAERFPKFAPTAALLGAEEAIAGTIPDSYNWLMNIFGTRGDLSHGMARLSGFLQASPDADAPVREEALIYDSYIRFYLGNARDAVWSTVSSDAAFDIRGNALRAFIRANIALSYRKADIASSTLHSAGNLPAIQAFPVFDYEAGYAALLRLDGGCTTYLERFAARNSGQLFTKDALQKAALAWYLKGDFKKASSLRASILKNGSLNTDADRQAQRFAEGQAWPNATLLTARLLIDGGFPGTALARLRSIPAGSLTEAADKIEYEFRTGRALEDSGDAAGALQAYRIVVEKGVERPEHFAARAALQMGGIYERKGLKAEAGKCYERCLSMRHHDMQSSIDQQAKAGLSRVR